MGEEHPVFCIIETMTMAGIVTLIVLGRKGPHGFPFRRPHWHFPHALNASFRNRLNVSLLHKRRWR